MNLDSFLAERAPQWQRLDGLVAEAGRRPERLTPEAVRELGRLYRAAAGDLAYARRRFRGDPVVGQLAGRVARARHVVYDAEPRRVSVRDFVTRGYWRRIRERPVPLLVSIALLVIATVLGGWWARHDPAAAVGVLPGQFRRGNPGAGRAGPSSFSSAEQAAFASMIFTNNIRVTFVAFAGGVLAGLPTALVLVQNGLILGVLGLLTADAGQGTRFVQLVLPHGVLELSCIAVAGAAGLRFGWALVAPGRSTRRDSVTREARATMELVLGTSVWLVVAGLVEGFVTPRALGLPAALTVGLGLGALFWALTCWRGGPDRPATGPDQSRLRAFARR